MAEIRDRLVLEDRFSSILDRYASRSSATGRAAEAAARQAQAGVSAATQNIVDKLAKYQDAIAAAYTPRQQDAAVSVLENQMRRLGVVYTSTAAEANSASLLTKESLQSLAEQGVIAANSLAESAYREAAARQRAAESSAAEKAAARQEAVATREAAAAQRAEATAARQAAREQERQAAAARREADSHRTLLQRIREHTSELFRNAGAAAKARQSHDVLGKRLLGVAAIMFTARRMLRFMTEAIARAPDSIQKSWKGMSGGIKDELTRGFVSMLQVMKPAMDRFNAFVKSPSGQRFARGFEQAMTLAGQAAAWLMDKATALGTWIGNNFSTVMEVAAIAAGLYAGNMLIAAGATVAAHLPMLLIAGALIAVVVGLNKAGVTAPQVFGVIGQAAGVLYASLYNKVAMLWNAFAALANFTGNVFKNPVAAIKILFFDMAITVLGYIQKLAAGIESLVNKIPGVSVNLTSGISGLMGKAAGRKNSIKASSGWTQYVPAMGYKDFGATASAWGRKASSIGSRFSSFHLDAATATAIKASAANSKSTAKHTGSAAKSAANVEKNLSDERLKYLEDIAVNKYEKKVNTTLAPNIKVVVQGGKDAEQTGRDIGAAIADILMRQAASHTDLNYAEAGV